MTFGTNLFLWGSMIWLVPLLYFLLKNECRPKKNIMVGVTLPWEGQHDPEVLSLLETFKKEMKYTCWIFLAAAIPCLFIRSFGLSMTAWLLWIVAVCFVFFIPYVRCNRALRQLKADRGWRRDADAPRAVTDLKAAAEELRWISPWWFLPPFAASLIPLLFDRTLWWLWALDAALIPLFYLCYRCLYRNRAEVVDEDSGRTLALTRLRRYSWGKCWILMAWATGAFNVGLWLTAEHIWLCMAVILLYGLTACCAVLGIELRVRRRQEELTADSGRAYYVDEDDRWIWGLLYYNPNDARTIVNARIGINSTFNLARRPAQIVSLFLLALLLACPLIGVWILGMENAPVELEVTDTEIVASHFNGEWRVPLSEVAEARLVEALPRLRRVAGTGLDSALTGQFSADGWGRITCCIDPRTGPWLLVTAEDGGLYLFGASEAGAAAALEARLR